MLISRAYEHFIFVSDQLQSAARLPGTSAETETDNSPPQLAVAVTHVADTLSPVVYYLHPDPSPHHKISLG